MKRKKIRNNLILFIPILILLGISLVNMFILGNTYLTYKNYFFKQALWFFLGFIIMSIIYFIKPNILFKYSKFLYIINVILLILVLFMGKTINGSRAWFSFGFISFQPSEVMKFSLALYLSDVIASKKKKNASDINVILTSLFITLIPSLFVFLEPDTGAIIIYLLIMLGAILVYGVRVRWFLILGGIGILVLGVFGYLYYSNKDLLISIIGTSFFYRVDRILTFVNNDSFQLDRALTAIGSSTLFSSNNNLYIPEAPTDFIIALTISNLGIISFMVIVLCFFFLDIYFIYHLFKFKNLKKKVFYACFLIMFIFAQIQNIGMNLGVLPIIGLPLPFLSYGGTNALVYFIFLGTLLSFKKKVN